MNREDLTSRAMADIRRKIVNLRLLPGVRISDSEMAGELGLSRTPVREALIRLAEQGLVEARHNRGFRVKDLTPGEVRDLYEVREALESLAVRKATELLTEAGATRLKEEDAAYRKLLGKGNLPALDAADDAFHRAIAELSGNRLLADSLSGLADRVRIVRWIDFRRAAAQAGGEAAEEHRRILAHILAGRANLAAKAVSDHILGSLKTVLQAMAT